MYLTPTNKHWIVDCETDGLRDVATRVWVVCVENAITDEAHTFTDTEEFRKWAAADDRQYVGHNFIAFDCPVLNTFVKTNISIGKVVDTFVLSMLYSPSLSGGHSLDAWGKRVGIVKPEHNDWSKLSDAMIVRCQEDVRINKAVFHRLTARMKEVGFTEQSAELEHLSWNIIQNKQRRRGFPFNKEGAEKLYAEIRERERQLQEEIYKLWPPQLLAIKTYATSRRKDGSDNSNYVRHCEQYPKVERQGDGSYTVFDWVSFNLGSPPQRVAKLLELGWEPVKFTKKTAKGGGGNPQVDEESLLSYAEQTNTPEIKALATWIVANSRANMIRTWLNAYNEKTGAIHGNLWIANTLRYKHDQPNSANVPAVRLSKSEEILRGEAGSWSYESRDLWVCGNRETHRLVGVDAKGIQLRVLAHYLRDENFTAAILSADPHTANQIAWGLATRAIAKTIVYAILMGAGDKRIASEAKISLREAKEAKEVFFQRVPGVRDLIKRLKADLTKTGRISLCDGSRIMVSSDHMVIPYLLQGDESRIMRQAAVLVDREVRRQKLEAIKVGDIHDEWQNLVRLDHVEPYKGVALAAFPETGKIFNYTVPIEGDAKVGLTWAETH